MSTETSVPQENEKKELELGLFKVSVGKKLYQIIALCSLIIIALGSFNDCSDAIEKLYNLGLSQFTTIPSQEKLDTIYIRSSASLLEETFGAPVYIKRSYSGDTIKYYRDKEFILSAITRDNSVVAYLVFPQSQFKPDTQSHSGGADLLSTPFNEQESVTAFRTTMSRMISYYIEENSTGEFSNLYSSVAGYSVFNSPLDEANRGLLTRLADDQTFGHDSKKDLAAVRNSLIPNFYGYTTLGVNALEDAILTKSEYRLITH